MRRAVALPVLVGLLTSTAAGEPQRVPGLLFAGGEVVPKLGPAPVDPALPRGHRITAIPRPKAQKTLCSPHMPVCVHAAAHDASLLPSLAHMESAYERVVYVLDLPAPRLDATLGGSPALDMYLGVRRPHAAERRDNVEPRAHHDSKLRPANAPETGASVAFTSAQSRAQQLLTHFDPAWPSEDTTSLFCTYAESNLSLQDATRCVAEAVAARLDAAESPSLRSSYSSELAAWVAGPDAPLLEAVDDLQSNPQLAAVKRDRDPLSPAGSLWFSFLDAHLGVAGPAEVATTMLSLSRSTTDDLHPEWHNEPDTFDVLRRSLPGGRTQEADVLAEWGHYRFFLGERGGGGAQGLPWLGYFGRPVFDWTLSYSSLPRKVASSRALEPLGVAAVWLELDEVPLGARLGVQLDWEEPVRFRWLIVALDDAGAEVSRWDLPFLQSGHHQEKTLMNFEAAAGLVFIGVNLGGVDATHPFDPDAEPWEPHGFTLYLADLQ